MVLDCGSPAETGYAFTGTTATTYQGTSSVTCATGYSGTASPTTITCEDTGSWSSVSGCTIKGTVDIGGLYIIYNVLKIHLES